MLSLVAHDRQENMSAILLSQERKKKEIYGCQKDKFIKIKNFKRRKK